MNLLRVLPVLWFFLLPACKLQKQPSIRDAEASLDLSADRRGAQEGWLGQLIKDSTPLLRLPEENRGWGELFRGDPLAAWRLFSKGKSENERIGATRAALELARAHQNLGRLVLRLTPALLHAQSTRPGAKAAWRNLLLARLAEAQGESPLAALDKIPAESPAASWALLLKEQRESPAGALLQAKMSGLNAKLPEGGTPSLRQRLSVKALALAGQGQEALRRWERISAKEADLRLSAEEVALDPGAADAGAKLYAQLAYEASKELKGWPQLLQAEALMILGRSKEAALLLEALLELKEEPSLAQLVPTRALDQEDLRCEARVLWALILKEQGETEKLDQLLSAIPEDRVFRRVLKTKLANALGKRGPEESFPDRRQLSRSLRAALMELGEQLGAQDLNDLQLIRRHVDEIQRLHAEVLKRADKPALAIKAREAAEDKTHSAAPSALNTLSSLTATVLDNIDLGRPRVAMKYLTRLEARLPAAAAPAEILRDLLSLKAMERGGSATAGQ